MLKMRLQRIGRKNDPSFRVVVTDSRNAAKRGRHVDQIGTYNAKMNAVTLDGEKAKHWLSKGVQASDTVHNLLVSQKVIEGKKRNVLPKKSPIINEEKIKAEEEAQAAAEAEVKEEAPQTETEPAPAPEAEPAPAEEVKEETKTE